MSSKVTLGEGEKVHCSSSEAYGQTVCGTSTMNMENLSDQSWVTCETCQMKQGKVLLQERNTFIVVTLLPILGYLVLAFYYVFPPVGWSRNEALTAIWGVATVLLMIHVAIATAVCARRTGIDDDGAIAVIGLILAGPFQAVWFVIFLLIVRSERKKLGLDWKWKLVDRPEVAALKPLEEKTAETKKQAALTYKITPKEIAENLKQLHKMVEEEEERSRQ
jgi:hypothetical protein